METQSYPVLCLNGNPDQDLYYMYSDPNISAYVNPNYQGSGHFWPHKKLQNYIWDTNCEDYSFSVFSNCKDYFVLSI